MLGPVGVLDDRGDPIDLGPFKQRSLFALLLINANEVVSTDRILDALWGEEADGKESALWVHVSRLRSALEPERKGHGESRVLITREPGYLLAVDEGAIDASSGLRWRVGLWLRPIRRGPPTGWRKRWRCGVVPLSTTSRTRISLGPRSGG